MLSQSCSFVVVSRVLFCMREKYGDIGCGVLLPFWRLLDVMEWEWEFYAISFIMGAWTNLRSFRGLLHALQVPSRITEG